MSNCKRCNEEYEKFMKVIERSAAKIASSQMKSVDCGVVNQLMREAGKLQVRCRVLEHHVEELWGRIHRLESRLTIGRKRR